MLYFLMIVLFLCGGSLGFSIAVIVFANEGKPDKKGCVCSSYKLSLPKQTGAVLQDNTTEEELAVDIVGAQDEEERGDVIEDFAEYES